MDSVDIGVAEDGTTLTTQSLQLTGTGSDSADFTWTGPVTSTGDAFNSGQTFSTANVPPAVASTTPANAATGVAADTDIVIRFSEDVSVTGTWFGITCAESEAHTATVSGGPRNYTLDPDTDFENGETCTVTLHAARITDLDDTPDNMASDYSFGFETIHAITSPVIINEADSDTDSTDELEFVELYDGGIGNTPLDGLVLVFFNGSNDTSYVAFDLDGYSTDINGYFLLGNAGVTPAPDMVLANNKLQNGADAVALYQGSATDFPNGTAVTTLNLVDAVVYGTGDTDDTGLLILLNSSQPQVDENSNGDSVNESFQRCPNGTGGHRNSDTYIQAPPTPKAINDCAMTFTRIHTIQGSGPASSQVGNTVTIEGVVVGDFQESGKLGGFFVQEEDTDADGDPATSEGIWVYSDATAVSAGDQVRVTGTVDEYGDSRSSLTEITGATVTILSSGNPLPTAAQVSLPVSDVAEWEHYEGMRITVPQTLTVAENRELGRYGRIVLSSGGRPVQFTNLNAPDVAGYAADQTELARRRIILDDGSSQSNPDPIVHPAPGLTASRTIRGGDTVTGLTGISDHRFGAYCIQPAGAISFTPANPRPGSPPDTGGTLRVASFNVLNYFNTFGPGNCGKGVGGEATNCRGADDADEFARQRAKIISALVAADADIVGLMELENDGYGTDSAIRDLVNGLNAVAGAGTYDFVDADGNTAQVNLLGTDAIKVGMIYKPATVTPKGNTAALSFRDDLNRPALARTFEEIATGRKLTVVVNHLKSKGCTGATDENADQGDGQGCWNVARTAAARALVSWLATDPTGSGDPDVLIIGDMNAYAQEDPVSVFKDADYTDLVRQFIGTGAYSYGFDGQWGCLDHALASSTLASQVAGVAEWHINADEPSVLDYNTEYKSAGQQTGLYDSDSYRSSDHDPVIIGLNLSFGVSTDAAKSVSSDAVTLCGTVADESGRVTTCGICWGTSSDPADLSHCTDAAPGDSGSFSVAVSGLRAKTTYYFRACAGSGTGTVYGRTRSFTTRPNLPAVTTAPIVSVGKNSAVAGGSVHYNDGISGKGLCWHTTHPPHVSLHPHTSDGDELGDFSATMTGLVPGTAYYYRAYAQFRSGTATYTVYGHEYGFTTPDGIRGDVNGDGQANLSDVVLILKILAGIGTDENPDMAGDADGNGRPGLPDAIYVLRHTALHGRKIVRCEKTPHVER
ncbi:ExeM/NucH family extracellular endonuclease [Desulfonema ishimotonii]|nr:ExeM/NucH family extracellular endonuclease [Desulfonema ishimotonii]